MLRLIMEALSNNEMPASFYKTIRNNARRQSSSNGFLYQEPGVGFKQCNQFQFEFRVKQDFTASIYHPQHCAEIYF